MTAQKLTREFCLNKTLIFYPGTVQEAIAVQKGLFNLGFIWADGVEDVQKAHECAETGIVLEDNKIYYHPSSETKRKGTVCSVQQLDSNYISPDQSFMLDLFNKMSARIDALTAEVAALKQQLEPQKLEKNRLKGNTP